MSAIAQRTFTEESETEYSRLVEKRMFVESEMTRLAAEAKTLDEMIAALGKLRPDLGRQKILRTRTRSRSPLLLNILRAHSGTPLAVSEVFRAINDKSVTESAVRDGLRYLANKNENVRAEWTPERKLTYRFREVDSA
jgi:hypothetical protein